MSPTAAFCLLSTLGGYLVTSFLLLKYPTLLHQRKKQRFLCKHISHRGGAWGPRTPNLVPVFQNTTITPFSTSMAGTWISKRLKHDVACQCEGKDNRIPLLKEVFEAFPNIPINIDIKVNNNVLIQKVSELVKQYKREHLTVWGNASYEIVEKCYKENSAIPILFSLQRVLLILGLFFTGLLPFVPIREQFFEIPMPSIILKLKEPHTISKGQKFLIWLSDILLMRKALFDHLTARGIQVSLFVLFGCLGFFEVGLSL
uniref:Glycerophosphodiester phosphodiesterase domain containing 1 n=1 Tax=Jaculus jaculus TaxID=51337 RepID=A0A8C5KCM6_JACJA